jgi:protoporphyrinogen oxidase
MMAENTMQKRVVIIGGGPAGLTAGYQLSKAGVESIVLEKDQGVGGISRTVNFNDYYFDIGGHRFFTKIREVEDMWREVLGPDLLRRKRLSRIYYHNKFFHYPLQPLNALFGLGIWNSLLIGASYMRAKVFPAKEEKTLEEWVSNRFGTRLFHTFFKTYTEKVWGIPCSEIRAEWAAQRIKGLSLIAALKNALMKSGNGRGDKKTVIKTLIDEFDYPKLGPGMMWETVARRIEENGSEVLLNAEVVGIRWEKDKVIAVDIQKDGRVETVTGTDFISSMPIREAIQKFNPPPPSDVLEAAGRLKYRDFLTVALVIDREEVFPDNWIYIHEDKVKVGRIQNFKNWSPFMVPDQSKTCLGLEYFCFEGDSMWTMPDEQLIELAGREVEALGFVNKGEVKTGKVVRMAKAYPVYDSVYQSSLEVMRKFLDGIDNLQLIGRNGQHKYNNQDHSMLTAMMAAENVLGKTHDLWQVNVDEEYHEEITEKVLMRVFARIDKSAFATALGSVAGLVVFLATIFLLLKGGEVVGPRLQLLGQYFIGYTVSLKGAFIGMAYSFFWAFLFGWLLAYARNVFVSLFVYRVKKRRKSVGFWQFMDSI